MGLASPLISGRSGLRVLLLSVVSAIGMALLAREQARTSTALQQVAQPQSAQISFQRAEKYFQQARSAVDQLGVRLSDRLIDIPGTETVRRDVLLDTLDYYRQFLAEASNDPSLQRELCSHIFVAPQSPPSSEMSTTRLTNIKSLSGYFPV